MPASSLSCVGVSCGGGLDPYDAGSFVQPMAENASGFGCHLETPLSFPSYRLKVFAAAPASFSCSNPRAGKWQGLYPASFLVISKPVQVCLTCLVFSLPGVVT